MSVVIVTGDGNSLDAPDLTTIVSVADLKKHCRVDISDDDDLIAALLGVAVDIVERKTQRSLLPRTFDWTRANLENGMRLPLAPVTQVRSLKYLTYPYGPQATLDPAQYIVAPDGQGTVIDKPYFLRWPWIGQGPNPVVVRFDAGDPAKISNAIKHAIKMIVADLYEYRTPNVLFSGSFQESKLTGGALGTVDALLMPEHWT